MSLQRALKRHYDTNHNPWAPPIRNYKNARTWPTYSKVGTIGKHKSTLHKIIRAVDAYGNSLGGGAGPRMPTKEEYARARKIHG